MKIHKWRIQKNMHIINVLLCCVYYSECCTPGREGSDKVSATGESNVEIEKVMGAHRRRRNAAYSVTNATTRSQTTITKTSAVGTAKHKKKRKSFIGKCVGC